MLPFIIQDFFIRSECSATLISRTIVCGFVVVQDFPLTTSHAVKCFIYIALLNDSIMRLTVLTESRVE